MRWIMYQCDPLDFGWEHLPTVEETAEKIASLDATNTARAAQFAHAEGYHGKSIRAFLTDLSSVISQARGKWGKEAVDFRGPVHVLWLPQEQEFTYAFVWKVDNNGTTYIASPIRLEWLEAIAS